MLKTISSASGNIARRLDPERSFIGKEIKARIATAWKRLSATANASCSR